MTSLIRERAAATPQMMAIFSDAALVDAALAFEIALAEATCAEELISPGEAALIREACANPPEIVALAEEAAQAGTLAIPLVARLRAQLAAKNPTAAEKLHLGATSQDVLDTALMLQAKSGVALIDRELQTMLEALASLAQRHASTSMLGRTLLQSARPITLGLKASHWLLALHSAAMRLRREASAAVAVQFGGPVGTRAGLGGKGAAIAARMASALGLADPPLPWHTRRDGIAGLATALGILIGAVAKIARDLALLAQGEVAEAFEPQTPGRGGSSAMPHKRNPTSCQIALSAQVRAPGLVSSILTAVSHEHERALGGWQAEVAVLAELFLLAHGSIAAMSPVIGQLQTDTEAMQRNLQAADVGHDIGESAALVERALQQFRKGS